jgi:IS605 OrfB family transposase
VDAAQTKTLCAMPKVPIVEMGGTVKLTLRVRVKDRHAAALSRMARDVNLVWNFANELTWRVWREHRRWLTGYDVAKYTAGSSAFLCIPAHTIKAVGEEHGRRRRQHRRSRLRWRSNGKSLGWVPFQAKQAQWRDGAVLFHGQRFAVWDSYGLDGYAFRSGSFSADARGRWYFNVVVEVAENRACGDGEVGVDLGLKATATYSDGTVFAPAPAYRTMEAALGMAQRARKKKRVTAIHAKIANRRKDALHKETTRLVRENRLIVVGDVSAAKLVKTRMAKSVCDASWSTFRAMLSYKAIRHSATFVVVNESHTTRTCSTCGARTGPQGVNGLRVREWTCQECGVLHDRDGNAARNTLALGCQRQGAGARVA